MPSLRHLQMLLSVPVLAVQPPQTEPMSLIQAEEAYLDAWDLGSVDRFKVPEVASKDQSRLQWLVSATRQAEPGNPFSRNTPAWQEAEAVRKLLAAPREKWSSLLASTPLTLSGSYMAVWQWGRLKVRERQMDAGLRKTWEDRLLAGPSPWAIHGVAMRHALCFALAEADTDRFTALKEDWEDAFEGLFPMFQSAFALIGSPAPTVRLWQLPGMTPVERSLGSLGSRMLWFEGDSGTALPELPAGTVWIVPTRDGVQPDDLSTLVDASLAEAKALVPRLEAARRQAFLAPIRKDFEKHALVYFPLRLDLDAQGGVVSIRMGDAARVQPSPAP